MIHREFDLEVLVRADTVFQFPFAFSYITGVVSTMPKETIVRSGYRQSEAQVAGSHHQHPSKIVLATSRHHNERREVGGRSYIATLFLVFRGRDCREENRTLDFCEHPHDEMGDA